MAYRLDWMEALRSALVLQPSIQWRKLGEQMASNKNTEILLSNELLRESYVEFKKEIVVFAHR